MKTPILKGKLTKISAALLALFQVPNLLSDLSGATATFAENAEKPLSVVSVVAALGIIWGGARRAFNYFS